MNTGVMLDCFFCGSTFQFGPHRYAGEYLSHYKISICETCVSANWDGVGPAFEEKLLDHLRARGMTIPARNAKDWLPLRN